MANRLKSFLNKNYQKWLDRNIPPRDSVTLNRRNIFILPTRNGLLYIFAAVLVFIAAINYAVSLAFGLAFFMVSVFILAILYAFNNLNQLTLSSQPTLAVFCGEQVNFKVLLSRTANKKHESLALKFAGASVSHSDLLSQDQDTVLVFTRAARRGVFRAPRLHIETVFPLGLCRAWSVVDLNLSSLVYPKPIVFKMSEFNAGASGGDDTSISKQGSEDYYGLREYVPGDSLRQVAWKNVARGQGMHVKEFVDYVDNKVWLDWDMFYGFSTEEKLSRLCYCVLSLSKTRNPFGLKIPGIEIAPDCGIEHKNKLLKLLALHK